MKVAGILHRETQGRDDDLRDAVLLGAGAVLVGGALWWTWRRTRPHRHQAPGWPGTPPRWNFSSKDGVGTAIGPDGRSQSRVWFTIRDGAFTEIFYPRVDQPAVRDLGLVVTDGTGLVSDERWDAGHEMSWLADGVPAYELINTCRQGRYRIEKTVFAHPRRNAVLQLTRFVPLLGRLNDYRLFALLSPHLRNMGGHNTAWVGENKGVPMLFAERAGSALALACSIPWSESSAGFTGSVSDGRRELQSRGRLARTYDRAENGNVVLTGEVDLVASDGQFLLALGFGSSPAEAAHHARASLLDDFDALREEYVGDWRDWQGTLPPMGPAEPGGRDLHRTSMVVLRSHEDKSMTGAVVASLSTPWGQARDDEKSGPVGYHVVWPRDLAEIAGGLLAAGANEDAIRILQYIQVTQDRDGHWPQNQWTDGSKAWDSIQMGETALPVLLLNLLKREGVLTASELGRYWPMARAAAGYILRAGPSSREDRWEDARGFTPFTLSVMIVALLVAAEFADARGETELATYLRESADTWNDSIDFWTYVEDTELARQVGVKGYYLRVAPPNDRGEPSKYHRHLGLWYRPTPENNQPPWRIVSPDTLAYVRFGLRAPDDPRILDTIKVVDALLKVDTPSGPTWHRYNHDGYGEKADGSPFDEKQGCGRGWPLLTGERAHYELAAGYRSEAVRLLHTLESFAGDAGMLPEQVWDTGDIPERGLYLGRPSGSAMPLAWAHAEYLKLRRSLADGLVFDTPPQAVQRYLMEKVRSTFVIWRANHRRRAIPAGKTLRIETLEPAVVRWHADGGAGGEVLTRDTGFGVHVADLFTAGLPAGSVINFTLSWPKSGRWNQRNGEAIQSDRVRVE